MMTFQGVEIEFDMRELIAALGDEQFAFRAVNRFLIEAGTQIQATWAALAQRLNVRETGAYIASIQSSEALQIVQRATREGPVVTGIVEVSASAEHATIIEVGHPAFHLPDKIDWGGPSVKVTASGKKLLHIPFRHAANQSAAEMRAKGTTTSARRRMMPAEIYAQAKELTRTSAQKVGPIHTKGGQFVQADRYTWGSHLRGVSTAGFLSSSEGLVENRRGEKLVGVTGKSVHLPGGGIMGKRRLVNPAWQSSRFEGMFKSGPDGHTEYMTIRTITPDSPGWNIPAKQGLYLARRVSQFAPAQLAPLFEASVLGALDKT